MSRDQQERERQKALLLRWTKRSLGIWSTWRMARKLLQQTASR